jgi:hypothetical protein
MKVCIVGSRDCMSLDILREAISQAQEQGIEVSHVLTGEEKGICSAVAEWAKEQGITLSTFPIKWNDISVDGAEIKERFNSWKKRKEPYNANAGKQRDELMLAEAEALISIDMETGHSKFTAIKATKMGIKVYEYKPMPIEDDLEEIIF